jgi:hypothetical protein
MALQASEAIARTERARARAWRGDNLVVFIGVLLIPASW